MRKKVGTHAVVTEIVDNKMSQKNGKILKFDGEPAVVRVSMGSTINTGNYSSLRLGVDLSLPCDPRQLESSFSVAEKFVSSHLSKMVDKYTPQSDGMEEVNSGFEV